MRRRRRFGGRYWFTTRWLPGSVFEVNWGRDFPLKANRLAGTEWVIDRWVVVWICNNFWFSVLLDLASG